MAIIVVVVACQAITTNVEGLMKLTTLNSFLINTMMLKASNYALDI